MNYEFNFDLQNDIISSKFVLSGLRQRTKEYLKNKEKLSKIEKRVKSRLLSTFKKALSDYKQNSKEGGS